MRSIIDISRSISNDAVVYPGDEPLNLNSLCTVGDGCPCKITQLGWTTHFLTHVDPPSHFISGGATLDEVPLERFSGKVLLVDVEGDVILPDHIPDEDLSRDRNLFFKTRNSQILTTSAFDQNHVYMSAEAASLAVSRGVNLIGIDYISIDRFKDDTYPAHKTLLGGNVLILEGLDLSDVTPGVYSFAALPLKISGGDGSPVRAILFEERS